MTGLASMIRRNSKLFFKDKGLFFYITYHSDYPAGALCTFLGNVYRDSFTLGMPENFTISDKLINAAVGGELFSSLLAVCCVTVCVLL